MTPDALTAEVWRLRCEAARLERLAELLERQVRRIERDRLEDRA